MYPLLNGACVVGWGTPVSSGMAFSAGLREWVLHSYILPGLPCSLWNPRKNYITAVLGCLLCSRSCKAWIFHLPGSPQLQMENWFNGSWWADSVIAECWCSAKLGHFHEWPHYFLLMMGSLDEMLLISSPSLGINLQRLHYSPRQPWLDFLPCLLRCKSGIHLARWLLDKCLNADLKILVETTFVPSGCEGRVTTFLSVPGDSCVAQSEHSSAGLQLLCMDVMVSRRKIPCTKVIFPSLPWPSGCSWIAARGGLWPAGLAHLSQAMLQSHCARHCCCLTVGIPPGHLPALLKVHSC